MPRRGMQQLCVGSDRIGMIYCLIATKHTLYSVPPIGMYYIYGGTGLDWHLKCSLVISFHILRTVRYKPDPHSCS